MAAMAQADMQNRKVEVNRRELMKILETNLKKHKEDYKAGMAGYKSALLGKIDTAFAKAKKDIQAKHIEAKRRVSRFKSEDIEKQSDYIKILDEITVEMEVPRCYEKEYEAAIDMAKWDVRETLELTHAEFTCFVRDEWSWKARFDLLNKHYTSPKSLK